MKKKFNIIEAYNWLSEAFVHQTEETTEQDTLDSYELKNRTIFYTTVSKKPISEWFCWCPPTPSSMYRLILSNKYDENNNIGTLIFKEDIKKIGDEIFWRENAGFAKCTDLASITLPNTVEILGINSFCGCTSLEEFTLPDSISYISEYTFSGCQNLKQIFYKGQKFTSKAKLRKALEQNGCVCKRFAFNECSMN